MEICCHCWYEKYQEGTLNKRNSGSRKEQSFNENLRGSLNKFPDFFRMGTFIDSTHMKLYSPSK